MKNKAELLTDPVELNQVAQKPLDICLEDCKNIELNGPNRRWQPLL